MEQTAAVLLSAAAERCARIDRFVEVSDWFEAGDARELIDVFNRARMPVVDPLAAAASGGETIHHSFPNGIVRDRCFRSDAHKNAIEITGYSIKDDAFDMPRISAPNHVALTCLCSIACSAGRKFIFASERLMLCIAAGIDLGSLQMIRRNLVSGERQSGSRR
jgi:hypothetical protein